MSETEIRAAIAEQEEYIKRTRSCGGVFGMPHRFAPQEGWSACTRCGVTQTNEDYHKKLEATL